jgi:excisionase family DNA binding protein
MEITDFVTVREVSKQLTISRSKLYQMMDRGELEYAKFGKNRRIPREAVKALIERSMVVRDPR